MDNYQVTDDQKHIIRESTYYNYYYTKHCFTLLTNNNSVIFVGFITLSKMV